MLLPKNIPPPPRSLFAARRALSAKGLRPHHMRGVSAGNRALYGVVVVLPDLLCLWFAGSLGKLTLWSSYSPLESQSYLFLMIPRLGCPWDGRSPAQVYGTVCAGEVSARWEPLCAQGSRTARCLSPELSWAARLPPRPSQLCLDRTLDRTRGEDARGAYPIRR